MAARSKERRARNWCVTINSTHELPSKLNESKIKFYVFGKERGGKTGRAHLQGYVEFKNAVSMAQAKTIIGDERAHLEPRQGSQQQAIEYCYKEDANPYTYGERKKGGAESVSNARDMKAEYMDAELEQLIALIRGGADMRMLIWNYPALYYKYESWIRAAMADLAAQKTERELAVWADDIKLNEKQQYMMQQLESQNDRQIDWICGYDGGDGKSTMTKYLLATRPNDVMRFTNAKTADIAQAYEGQSIVFFDLSRTVEGKVNYGAIEDLKNGMLFAAKYKSKAKIYVRPPKVMILANFEPEKSAMSADRWRITVWDAPQLRMAYD